LSIEFPEDPDEERRIVNRRGPDLPKELVGEAVLNGQEEEVLTEL